MSRIATWSDLAIRSGYAKPFHLEPGVIYAVIGVLKAAGYRSAINYLDAAKRVHVEQGRPWTSQLQQAYRKAKRSAERDLGASKQAQPLDFELMAKASPDLATSEKSPARPGKSVLIASWWLLREIEASNAKWQHVTVDRARLRVHWVSSQGHILVHASPLALLCVLTIFWWTKLNSHSRWMRTPGMAVSVPRWVKTIKSRLGMHFQADCHSGRA